MDPHDLTAAYALHALDAEERELYEAHLAQCARCRDELAELTESAAALAWAVASPPPPEHLRARILDATENVSVLPTRRRWPAIAAVAASVAIGLGVWAGVEHASHGQSLQVVALQGRHGMVARSSNGDAVLVVDRLPAAPTGMTYEAWVIPPGGKPHRAGLFDGGAGTTMVKLRMHVPRGAVVAATMERDGGVDAPTRKPLLTAQL